MVFKQYRRFLIISGVAVGLGLIAIGSHFALKFYDSRQPVTEYAGFKLGQSKDEVLYERGKPTHFFHIKTYEVKRDDGTIYVVRARTPEEAASTAERMRASANNNAADSISLDYSFAFEEANEVYGYLSEESFEVENLKNINHWVYVDSNPQLIILNFDPKSQTIKSITCAAFKEHPNKTCPKINEVANKDTENTVKGIFGNPTVEKISGGNKYLIYKKQGIYFSLHKKRVYNITVSKSGPILSK